MKCHLCGQEWKPPQDLKTIDGTLYWAGKPFGSEKRCTDLFVYLMERKGQRLSCAQIMKDLKLSTKWKLINSVTMARREMKAHQMPFVIDRLYNKGYMLRQK